MPVNLANRLRRAAAATPDKPAVVLCSGGAGYTAERHTFRELDRDSDAAARGFLDAGIGRGTKTLVMLRPSFAFFSCFFALFKVGAVPVFIDPGMGGRRLLECVRVLAPEAMVGLPLAHLVRKLFPRSFPGFKTAVTHGRRWFWGGKKWDTLRRPISGSGDEPFPVAETSADEMAAILFTTGSTGPAKGVEYSHGALDKQVGILSDVFGIRADDRDAATFPGFSLFSIALGMTAVIPDMNPVRPGSVFPPNVLEPARGEGCTFSFGSPALWGRVSQYAAEKATQLPAMRRVIMAGAPVPAEVHERLLHHILPAGAETFTPYGATEVMPVACIGGREILAETAALTAEGKGVCVGRPATGVRVEIIRIDDAPIPEWDDALILPQGQIGEIAVKADHASRRYHNLPKADALAKISDAAGGGAAFWHRMGDVGYRDEKGRIWFCGRKAHRVKAQGGDMFTVCCEAIFNRHPAVRRSALVGVPSADGAEKPVIVIELQPEPRVADTSAVKRELEKLAVAHPLTARIKDILFHEKFPTDIRHNAKIRREDLAAWAAAEK
jgi:acyl-CoA synthetase (AMP-forming)/AMP-acid ligase II